MLTHAMRVLLPAIVGGGLLWTVAAVPLVRAPSIFGFSPSSAHEEHRIERRFLAGLDAGRIRGFHRYLTREPHVAGSPRNRVLAEWQRDLWQAWGLEDVRLVTHTMLLPYPEDVGVEMLAPARWHAALREPPIAGDPDTAQDAGPAFHAFSGSGDVTAPVVYAGSGRPEDYEWLTRHGVDVRGRIVLVRYPAPYSYRGFTAFTAQQRGAAALLVYSDPADDGALKGRTYPDGPWGPESHIQRGGIAFDFLVPGDPLTPGWPSISGAGRIAPENAAPIPKIPSVPLAANDARRILQSLGGPEAPLPWRGGLPLVYRAGPGGTVRVRVRMENALRQVQTVIGHIRGREHPEQEVIVGNHRDAWVFGGVDPGTGSASLMELARGMGRLLASGVRPARTIVFASWDAEEFTLGSSTEWGEQFAGHVSATAVAYLNVDSAASGPTFAAAAVPSLTRLVRESARDVPAPDGRLSIGAAARQRLTAGGALTDAADAPRVVNRLGSGSDYAVFLDHLGVPVVEMRFEGPYGVYHSLYDTHAYVERFADPGFRSTRALTGLWGVMALRLANADALPFEFGAYAQRLAEFAAELRARAHVGDAGYVGPGAYVGPGFSPATSSPSPDPVTQIDAAIRRFARAARVVDTVVGRVPSDPAERLRLNRALLALERAFTDPAGIRGRPWFRHQIYAPAFSYAAEVLPGPAEALAAGDVRAFSVECERVAAAIGRAAAVLESSTNIHVDDRAGED